MFYEPCLNDEVIIGAVNSLKELYCHDLGFLLETVVWIRDGHRRSPYRALILFGLSQREDDQRLIDLCLEVFERYPTLETFVRTPHWEMQKLREVFERFGLVSKRMQFIESAQSVIYKNGNVVPQGRELLMKIYGVGEKTVECILGYGFGKPALPVDSHVCQVIERIVRKGITSSNAPYVRKELKRIVGDENKWIDTHELLRLHGISICKKKEPQCELCPVKPCRYRKSPFERGVGILRAQQEARRIIDSEWEPWRQLICDP